MIRPTKKHRPRTEPPRAAEPPLSAGAVRQFLLRAAELADWDAAYLREILGVDAGTGAEVLAALEMAGYIELSGRSRWRNTPEGNRVAGVTAAPPIKRATLQKNLDAFLARVREVNSDVRFAFRVEEAVLFGPFLTSDADRVKNVDIALRLAPKQAGASGAAEVLRYLRGRARSIELFALEDWILRQPHRTVFEEPS